MTIHHLNCATMCPFAPFGLLGDSPELIAHVVVIETARAGLVVVDSGFGVEDCTGSIVRLGLMPRAFGPRFDVNETVLRRVQALGHSARDVQHIVLTHLDFDHAGGIPDFPHATVHVMAKEHEAATQRRDVAARSRYRAAQWKHGPRWQLHDAGGEMWNGFDAVRAIDGLNDDVLMIPLEGHTPGHAGVAIKDGDRYLLHAGDAYFHPHEIRGADRPPAALAFFSRAAAMNNGARRRNRDRLRALDQDPRVTIFCAHSKAELDRLR